MNFKTGSETMVDRSSVYKTSFFLPVLALCILAGCRSEPVDRRSWSVYKGDAESTSYSALQQVNRQNVGRLEVAWMFRPNDAPDNARFARSECNPIVVDGVMYATSDRHRLYAIDAGNGQQIWSFDPFDGGRGGGIYRGVTYWEDGEDRRILFTARDRLYAIDAGTGRPIPEFGEGGSVSMNTGLRGDPDKISIVPTSPGIIYRDLIIMGTEVSELYGAEPGYIRAYDVRTGQMEWVFHTIPRPGEFGYETWPEDAWKYAGGANNWAGMSLDRERGLVFASLGSPTYDFYGADRKGKNLFGNSVVALDA
ncbi:MAG: PQQ-binding-like beta-propeller repeat protein, partial [Balneolaceae bacterium]|nr:PQQ-binding-like beta-propeller repeat protein [Balneolaceae bacterium]